MIGGRLLAPAAVLALWAAPLAASPQEAEGADPPAEERSAPRALQGLVGAPGTDGAAPSISADEIEEIETGLYRLTGYADVRYGDLRLQADRILYDSRANVAEAEGDVVLIQGEGTLGAARMVMNLETGEATLWDVNGYTPPYYQFRAARLERQDAQRFSIYDAVFTTCTQPIPYWSFKVKKGRVRLEHYAHLRGVAFKTGRLPVLYLPYLLWPVKQERATGLLMPQVGSSNERGFFVGNALFWAMRRNMDATFFLDYYSLAGFAGGLEYRYVPNAKGQGRFVGYILPSDVDEEETTRYRYRYDTDQRFGERWTLLADLNVVSDAQFYRDFERDFGRSVNVQELSNLDLTRAWSYYTLNLRAERRKQFLGGGADLVQRRLPELEIRARSRRLGGGPLYLSFNASANGMRREEAGLDADYQRLDAGLTLSAALRPAPWLDVTPTLSVRDTYYSQRRDGSAEDGVADEGLNRELYSLGVEILGPKFFRLFEPPPGSSRPRFKNTIEPRLIYRYVSDIEDEEDVLLFDELDTVTGDLNSLTWALTTRLLRKRRVERGPEPGAEPGYESAREIASLELRQTTAFNRDLTVSAAAGADGEPLRATGRGPLSLIGRYNPSRSVSADLRLDYDPLFDGIRTVSLSANASSRRLGHVRGSYYVVRDLETDAEARGTLRLGGGSAFWRRKLSLDLDFSYDLEDDRLESQRYQLGYQTQCCGFQVEYREREFGGLLEPAREYRFMVSLQGIGTFLDLNSRTN